MMGGRRRKMRGGNGYGVGQPLAVGALEYVPNMTSVPDGAAYKPTGGRRRRRSRRGGDHGASAPPADDDVLVTKGQCTAEDRKWIASGMKAANGESLGYCRGTTGWSIAGPKGKHGGRRRTRRRGGMEASAPGSTTKANCSGEGEQWTAAGWKNSGGEEMGYCRRVTDWQVSTTGQHKGGRRHSRRKHKGRRRTMRGGGSVSGVGYGFAGSGVAGLANPQAYPSNLPPGGAFAIPR